MDDNLFVGMIVYHRTGNTKAQIQSFDNKNVTILLSQSLSSKTILTLPITHFGEWLFFESTHHALNYNDLATDPRYLKYKNKNIIQAYQHYIEVKRDPWPMRQTISTKSRSQKVQKKKLFLQNIIERYNFDGFYHYTHFSNFVSIMQSEYLYSRKAVDHKFIDAADKEVIANTKPMLMDYVRLFFKEKTPTIYRNEGVKADNNSPHMAIPVILLFKKSLIYHRSSAFISGCGGSSYSIFTTDINKAVGFDWDTIFGRGPIKDDEHKQDIINKRNAEFLYKDKLSTKHLKKIIFRSPADLKHAIHLFGMNNLFSVNNNKFNNHLNYLKDYHVVNTDTLFELTLEFLRDNIQQYNHELAITFLDGTKIYTNLFPPKIGETRVSLDTPNILKFTLNYNNFEKIAKVEYLMNNYVSAIWRNRSD